RLSAGCTTRTPWPPTSWPRASASSTPTPASSSSSPGPRSPRGSPVDRSGFVNLFRLCRVPRGQPWMRSRLMPQAVKDIKPTTDRAKTAGGPLSAEELGKMDAYWRASNYLSVGQIYLLDNPLLREPLKREHIKPRLLGHWGTSPGLNMLCVHLNRVIK